MCYDVITNEVPSPHKITTLLQFPRFRKSQFPQFKGHERRLKRSRGVSGAMDER